MTEHSAFSPDIYRILNSSGHVCLGIGNGINTVIITGQHGSYGTRHNTTGTVNTGTSQIFTGSRTAEVVDIIITAGYHHVQDTGYQRMILDTGAG